MEDFQSFRNIDNLERKSPWNLLETKIYREAIHGYTHKATHRGVFKAKQTPARNVGQEVIKNVESNT